MGMKAVVVAAVLCAVGGLVAAHEPAAAADLDRPYAVKKRLKYKRHHHRSYAFVVREDPYAYQYEPRGYYPYYRSGYWSPAAYVRYRNRLHYNVWNRRPPNYAYYRSWGYPLKYWPHKAWHAEYHGRHWPWHW